MGKSKFEKTAGTKIRVSKAVAAAIGDTDDADFVGFSCSITSASIGRGQKQDIDVTTLCSEVQENANGLAAAGEISLSALYKGDDEGQKILGVAYDTDAVHEFEIILPSGYGWRFLAEVRDAPIEIGVNAVVNATYTLRVSGKVELIEPVAGGGTRAAATTKAAK